MKNKVRLLVICTGNSCRSQMAHGYLQHFGGSQVEVYSAGVEVHGVNPITIGIMAEEGINILHHTSNHVDEYKEMDFDYIITVCNQLKESCPYFSSKAKKLHHSFPDPYLSKGTVKEILNEYRTTSTLIKKYCKELIDSIV